MHGTEAARASEPAEERYVNVVILHIIAAACAIISASISAAIGEFGQMFMALAVTFYASAAAGEAWEKENASHS